VRAPCALALLLALPIAAPGRAAGYLAPEQARGQAVDARGDLFSVGAILYEMLTGRRAFLGESVVETLHAVIAHQPPPLGDARLDHLLSRCLAKNPAQRIASARELEQELLSLREAGLVSPA
jgi:serine/threonine protein kinase